MHYIFPLMKHQTYHESERMHVKALHPQLGKKFHPIKFFESTKNKSTSSFSPREKRISYHNEPLARSSSETKITTFHQNRNKNIGITRTVLGTASLESPPCAHTRGGLDNQPHFRNCDWSNTTRAGNRIYKLKLLIQR